MLQTSRTFQRANTIRSGEWHLLRLPFLFTRWALRYIQPPSNSKNPNSPAHPGTCVTLIFVMNVTAEWVDPILTAGAMVVPSPCCYLLRSGLHLLAGPTQHSPITSHPLRPAPSGVGETVQETQTLLLRQIHFSISTYPRVWTLAEDLRDHFDTQISLWDTDLHRTEPTAVQMLWLPGDGAAIAGNYPTKKGLVFWFLIQLRHFVTFSRDHNVT